MRTRLGVLLAGAMAIGGARPSCVGGGPVYGGPPVEYDAGVKPPAPVYGGPPPMPDAAPPDLDAGAMLDSSSKDVKGDASVAKSKPDASRPVERMLVPAYGLVPPPNPNPFKQ